MKELVLRENQIHRLDLPSADLAEMRALRGLISARSQMAWGEHCTECTYPSCYASCSHYTPRADMHCRRFDRGIETVRLDGLSDPLMRIRFRKWGKLEGEGPTRIVDMATAQRWERVRELTGRAIDSAPLPYEAQRGLVWLWKKVHPHTSPATTDTPSYDYLVIECIGSSKRSVAFTVSVLPNSRLEQGLFQERIVVGPGYTRAVIPARRIAAHVDLTRPYLVQLEPLEESPSEEFVFGLIDFVVTGGAPLTAVVHTSAGPRSQKGAAPKVKCVVWDLDNTVWRGTLAEDGVDALVLDPRIVEVMQALDARGILQSVASKNDEAEALAALQRFGIADYVLYPQIGWGPKSQSLQRIAQLLDIGLDTFVFIDDQPFERSEVSETLPQVTAFAETEIPGVLEHPRLNVPVTAESGRRRQMYREEMKRQIAFETTGAADYHAFVRSCEMRLTLSQLTPADVTRIFDLSQRTNQVNVSGARYERDVVEQMARGVDGQQALVMRCEDRFGDYGVIGFALVDLRNGLVEDFFMSCRVQRKFVEHALFNYLAELVQPAGAARLRVRYRKTDRNKLALRLLADLGFELREEAPGIGWLERRLEPVAGADVVCVVSDSALQAEEQGVGVVGVAV